MAGSTNTEEISNFPARILTAGVRSDGDEGVKKELEASGYVVDRYANDVAVRRQATAGNCSLVILDAAPSDRGYIVLLRAIKRSSTVPVLVLFKRGKIADLLEALNEGADNYLVKPVAISKLLFCVEELMQRTKAANSTVLRLADLELDWSSRKCFRNGSDLSLSTQEFSMLRTLFLRQGQVVSRAVLAQEVWGRKFDEKSNMVEVAIARLRKKLDGSFELKLVNTVRGEGYFLGPRSDIPSGASDHLFEETRSRDGDATATQATLIRVSQDFDPPRGIEAFALET
ncbi:response regulator transcription factor [Variovorax sp. PAMC26660]|uniref:response regulator transcription factor n=1 Tax=Variovorax sp. PAMC26660 TaxID=2762322 RepID=UPI00164D44DA|nr:response regulator transcription factor [Variovorax sp. PAMC26660]QNK67186.1 winged helix-turn-helix domain-containing protein [Variovorax sp. PAMC26660]